MPPDELHERSFRDLVDGLGKDDVATRQRAQDELTRRSLGQVSIKDDITAILPGVSDPEVAARLRAVLNACRYYARALSVEVEALDGGGWSGAVEFKFGTSETQVDLTTPPVRLSHGTTTRFGPRVRLPARSGIQFFNSAQHGVVLECGDEFTHHIYVEAAGLGSHTASFKMHCNGQNHDREIRIVGHAGATRREILFVVSYEVKTVCGAAPPS